MSRFWESISFIPSLTTKKEISEGMRNKCPIHDTLTVNFLFGGDLSKSVDTSNCTEKGGQECGYIKDHYVFYGAHLEATSDLVTPPTHTPIPGVYFHAMALDNLLYYGEDYISEKKFGLFPEIGLSDLMEILTLISLFTLSSLQSSLFDGYVEPSDTDKEVAKNLRVKIISSTIAFWLVINIIIISSGVMVIYMATFYAFEYLRIPPVDFVGLLGLVGIKHIPALTHQFNTLILKPISNRIEKY